MMSAEVAVLMAAYNAEATLRAAVDGILASTVPCDLYVVDDCSRVPVETTIGKQANVTIIRLPRNGGLASALNVGLAHILPLKYKYIARMDADDVSYPHRFASQIASGLVACAISLANRHVSVAKIDDVMEMKMQ